jgi:hypothetical protein
MTLEFRIPLFEIESGNEGMGNPWRTYLSG